MAGERLVGRAVHVPVLGCLAWQEVVRGMPCNQAGISGPSLSGVWGQDPWGQAGHALPIIGAGVPAPWPLSLLLPTAWLLRAVPATVGEGRALWLPRC